MNFLGHFFLSYHDEALLAGNFLADFVKGKKYLDYPEGIANGILMHRKIDDFTDNHPSFWECRKLLSNDFNHYSGIIVDMYFDHFLAADWSSLGDGSSLTNFSHNTYQRLEAQQHEFPVKAVQVLYYMKMHDWLGRYISPEGIGRSLRGIGLRLRHPFPLERSIDNLHQDYHAFQGHFMDFYKDLVEAFPRQYSAKP